MRRLSGIELADGKRQLRFAIDRRLRRLQERREIFHATGSETWVPPSEGVTAVNEIYSICNAARRVWHSDSLTLQRFVNHRRLVNAKCTAVYYGKY